LPAAADCQAAADAQDWQAYARARLLAGQESPAAFSVGQDIWLAARLADKHVNVAGILAAYRRRIEDNLNRARRDRPLAPGSTLAEVLGTRFPILQAPLVGVSDVPGFCDAVLSAGAMPFVALSLMSGAES